MDAAQPPQHPPQKMDGQPTLLAKSAVAAQKCPRRSHQLPKPRALLCFRLVSRNEKVAFTRLQFSDYVISCHFSCWVGTVIALVPSTIGGLAQTPNRLSE